MSNIKGHIMADGEVLVLKNEVRHIEQLKVNLNGVTVTIVTDVEWNNDVIEGLIEVLNVNMGYVGR